MSVQQYSLIEVPKDRIQYFNDLLGREFKTGDRFTVEEIKKIEQSLNLAHELRKFEIELYWKRATYYWAFIALILTGFSYLISIALQQSLSYKYNMFYLGLITYLLSVLGYFMSLCLTFINIGSKFWQSNWERHVDLLEKIAGINIYKLKLDSGRDPISINRVNVAISVCFMVFCIIGTVITLNIFGASDAYQGYSAASLLLISLFSFACITSGNPSKSYAFSIRK